MCRYAPQCLRFCFVAIAIAIAGASASAQTVVQLPSIHVFSYSGSVLVPDSGGAFLGGVSRGSAGRARRGVGPNSVFGGAALHSGASVAATIIDHREIDRRIRGIDLSAENDGSGVDRTEEGKALVRHARRMFRGGDHAGAKVAYQMAVQVLDGRLKELANAEYRRVFGLSYPSRRDF